MRLDRNHKDRWRTGPLDSASSNKSRNSNSVERDCIGHYKPCITLVPCQIPAQVITHPSPCVVLPLASRGHAISSWLLSTLLLCLSDPGQYHDPCMPIPNNGTEAETKMMRIKV